MKGMIEYGIYVFLVIKDGG